MKEYRLTVNAKEYVIEVKRITSDHAEMVVNGVEYDVGIVGINDTEPSESERASLERRVPVRSLSPGSAPVVPQEKAAAVEGVTMVSAPIPGAIIEIFVKEGDKVAAGAALLKLEAMKMENVIDAPVAGSIKKVHVETGQPVGQGAALVEIE